MNNLSVRKGARVREIVEASGCELLCLPPYLPDPTPIKEAFSGFKARSEGRAPRDFRGADIEALGRALDPIQPRMPQASSAPPLTRSSLALWQVVRPGTPRGSGPYGRPATQRAG